MKILILNWRDIKNPSGGGAEILTHELAKGWVGVGHEVTVFSSSFLGGKPTEVIDGVEFIRRGSWWNVHFFAFLYYLKNKNNVDLIIDEVHWFPFFSTIYAKKKTITLTCEVANKLFFTIFPYPIALFFRGIEKIYLQLYKNIPTMTISESTKKDLIKEGVKSSLITVLPMGVTIPNNLKKFPREKNPTFIYLARLNKQKGIFDAITAFAKINDQRLKIKDPQFWIVGSGEENVIKEIKELVRQKGLEKNVKFFGYVDENKKFELLARAHLLLVPSAHEGWGLTVIEATAQGTPAVAYNTGGLRDTVSDQKTGIVLKRNSSDSMSKEAINLLTEKIRYNNYQKNCIEWAKNFNWNKSIKESLSVIKNYEK